MVSKDIYEYLMNFVDGDTLIKMTSVNKKFNNDIYFKRFLERNCPKLFKRRETTYKSLYIKYKEFIEFMNKKRFKIDEWRHPKDGIFFNITYRCTQYEKDISLFTRCYLLKNVSDVKRVIII